MSETKPVVSIVIPVFNEEKIIGNLLRDVCQVKSGMEEPCEIIVVNDRSADRTEQVAKGFSKEGVSVILNQNPQGKGGALRTGFDAARGECIVMMDGDGSHQAIDIPKIAAEVLKTKGLVIGSRIYGGSQEYTRTRAFGNIFFTWFFGFIHGRYLSDALNGFKGFHRDIYQKFFYSSNGFEIEIELLVNALALKRSITEVPSMELCRQGGEVKSRVIRDGFRFLWRILQERFQKRRFKSENQ